MSNEPALKEFLDWFKEWLQKPQVVLTRTGMQGVLGYEVSIRATKPEELKPAIEIANIVNEKIAAVIKHRTEMKEKQEAEKRAAKKDAAFKGKK